MAQNYKKWLPISFFKISLPAPELLFSHFFVMPQICLQKPSQNLLRYHKKCGNKNLGQFLF